MNKKVWKTNVKFIDTSTGYVNSDGSGIVSLFDNEGLHPLDYQQLKENIEKAIIAANLGFNPSNDGETIRIVIPALTEERRRELTKQVKAMAEEAKVSIRNIRHEANEKIEKMELPEDEEKGMMKDVQDLVNDYNKDIDNIYKDKEKELMTV